MSEKLKELKVLGIMLAVFLAAYFIPFESVRLRAACWKPYMLQDMPGCMYCCVWAAPLLPEL